MEIAFNDRTGKYELHLPKEIISDLHLLDIKSRDVLIPVHADKLKLEWLAQDIEKQHAERQDYIKYSERRDRINQRLCFACALISAGLFAYLGKPISRYFSIPFWAVGVLGSIILMYFVCGYIRIGIGFPLVNLPIPLIGPGADDKRMIIESLEILRLQNLIKEEFS